MQLKHNVGGTERWVRIILGVILTITGYMVSSWLWGVVGLVIFITGIIKWCPIYKTFKMSTCKVEKTTSNVGESNTEENTEN